MTTILQDKCFIIVSSRDDEIKGKCETYETIFASYSEAVEYLNDVCGKNPIIVGLTVKIPKSAFEPKLQLEIDIPESAFEKKPIQAELNEISIPIELNEKKTSVKVKETLEDGDGAGIIAFLKKMFKGEK